MKGSRRLPMPLIFGALLMLNGVIMWLLPGWWYESLPGVAESGPFNAHFVRDIGGAFIAIGLGLALARRLAGLPADFAYLPAALFLLLHGGTHLVELGHHGPLSMPGLAVELVGVYLPALLMLKPLGRALLHGGFQALKPEARIRAMEKALGVPLDYMRDIQRDAPHLLNRVVAVSVLSRQPTRTRQDLQGFAALGAVMAEDCGECLQIHVNLALKAGAPPALLKAAMDGRFTDLPPDLALAFRYGRAVALREEIEESLREQAFSRFGRMAVTEMAFAVALARFYPTLKRGLGHARACSLIRLELAA